ncbi:hypothetical protein B0J14DRAFT_585825 [Halenospora varia]|nr:hypothetical protein B0J14DRAFT_585825 [Halenospora varia]
MTTLTTPTSSPPAAPPNPLDSIPPLATSILTSDDDKTAALKLVADSIAQQRQLASRAIIFHPLTMALYIALMATISQFLYKTRGDTGVVLTTCAGVTMACLIAIRGATGGYLTLAEEMKWSFLENDEREEDVVLGSKFGDEIIGAVVLRLERNPPSPSSKRKGSGKSSSKHSGGKGIVRAWTVRMKYRGKGVGTELLEEAVKITRRELGGSAEIGFAKEHANSGMVVPELFNGGFRRREKRAAKLLEGVVESMEGRKKR